MTSDSHIFLEPVTLDSPSRFFNRELSWLAFNQRVLEESMNKSYPLLERLRFLAISGSNLDEFFMVRIAGILAQIYAGVSSRSEDGRTPQEQLNAINERVEILRQTQDAYFHNLKTDLEKEGIILLSRKQLSKEDLKVLKEVFKETVFPVLTPIILDPSHPFPWLENLSRSLIFTLKDKKGNEQKALLPLPNSLPRFIRLNKTPARFITLEEVMLKFISKIFPNFKVKKSGVFSIIRNSLLQVDERAEDLVSQFETALDQQKRGDIIGLVMNQEMPYELEVFLTKKLNVESFGVVRRNSIIGTRSLSGLIISDRKDLVFKPYKQRIAERIKDFKGDHFAAIRKKDMVIHHPYESFEVVVKFLRQAAKDPDVVSIKQTLYRTNKNSPIVKALIDAARAGKAVTAIVELRARFDEQANIKWAKDMEKAGVHVVFGLISYKTHAKISLVTRKENGKMKAYAHFGTGNYHEVTANLYTDLSFFTCDKTLCADAALVFNYLTGYVVPTGLKKLSIAPLNLRDKLIKLIEKEISYAKKGKPANIWAKMNSLLDDKLIDALYRASQAGVKINLIIRGICALRPGIEGLSENIKVKSIIGRFLEHARIFCFGNGYKLPCAKSKVFISSADWMQRNTIHRIETLVPIENETVHEQILNQIMQGNIKDEALSWSLDKDMNYTRVSESLQAFSCHQFFMTHPSLSGRGSAKLRDIVARQKKAVREEEKKAKAENQEKTNTEEKETKKTRKPRAKTTPKPRTKTPSKPKQLLGEMKKTGVNIEKKVVKKSLTTAQKKVQTDG